MDEERENFERTEEPTPKRREEARKKGQVAVSRAVVPTAILLTAVLVMHFSGSAAVTSLERIFVGFFSLAGGKTDIGLEELFSLARESGLVFTPLLASLFAASVFAGTGSGLLQTGFLLTGETLQPDLSRINPVSGLKRLFTTQLMEMLKSFLAVVVLGALGFFFIYRLMPGLAVLSTLGAEQIVLFGGQQGMRLIAAGVGVMGVLAGLDYLYQRQRTEARLRMSPKEIKEEMREQEGDPLIKSRLKGIRHKLARQRMMEDVAKADVIITNPQELAVALGYRMGEMAAPRVLAKGAGFIAEKIREIARQKGVPIVENKPLARLLYRTVEVGREIPETLYKAVAEVLAYVYRLRRR